MALSIGVDIGLFHHMVKDGDQPKKAEDMAETLGIHPPLLCKYLVPWNIPSAMEHSSKTPLTQPLTSATQVA